MRPTWDRRPKNPYWTQHKAGIIFYRKEGDQIYFLFGHDKKIDELIDFSSFVRIVDKTPEKTVIRAIKDKCFGLISIGEDTLSLPTTIYIQDQYSLILLIKLNEKSITEMFQQILDDGRYSKLDKILWISDKELLDIITYEKPIMKRQVRCMMRDISKIMTIL